MTSYQVDSEGTPTLTDEDCAILDSVERYLSAGLQLKQWWEKTYPTNAFAERFDIGVTVNRPDTSFGYFDHAPVDGQNLPIMGNFQDMFYDQPKAPTERTGKAGQWMQDQIREFVLHYFMRVSDFREPRGVIENGRCPPPAYLRPIYFCPGPGQQIGFGFSQLFYKQANTGEIGQFPEEERFAIVDLRDIGPKYEWIVLKVNIFDFSFTYAPLGDNAPKLVLPLGEASYLVVNRDLIANQDNPEPGLLGEYGFGYAFIKNPAKSLLAYGPGEFDAAYEQINFRVFEDGRTRVQMVFVSNQPERIVNLSLDPVDWSFTLADLVSFGLPSRFFAPMKGMLDQLPFRSGNVDPVLAFVRLLNRLTGDLAAKEFCISVEDLKKVFLVKHFTQHYQTIAGSLQTWRQIPDWLVGEENLFENPETRWVITGVST